MVMIGSIGTIEGPLLGALVYFLLPDSLADLGNWYRVIVGGVAIAFLLAPTGSGEK
jgi:branched-chain amino acid transport system permease protein